jgi:hypothetical protein
VTLNRLAGMEMTRDDAFHYDMELSRSVDLFCFLTFAQKVFSPSGPLQCERDGRFYLVGVVSYDVATSCRATGMTYFTKIRGVQGWIEGQLDKSLLDIAASSQS